MMLQRCLVGVLTIAGLLVSGRADACGWRHCRICQNGGYGSASMSSPAAAPTSAAPTQQMIGIDLGSLLLRLAERCVRGDSSDSSSSSATTSDVGAKIDRLADRFTEIEKLLKSSREELDLLQQSEQQLANRIDSEFIRKDEVKSLVAAEVSARAAELRTQVDQQIGEQLAARLAEFGPQLAAAAQGYKHQVRRKSPRFKDKEKSERDGDWAEETFVKLLTTDADTQMSHVQAEDGSQGWLASDQLAELFK